MRALRQKAGSQRGASITFALLLFLVCAVISSVVIVAATAVGGRASKMAEMDQRYYAVNSAAELVRDVLEHQTVVITVGSKTVSIVDQDENPTSAESKTDLTPEVTLNGTPSDDTDSLVTAAAMKIAQVDATPILPTSLALTATIGGMSDSNALDVTMTPILDADTGKLYIDLYNADTAKGAYTLRLTFKADSTQSVNNHTTYGTIIPTRDGSGKMVEGKYTREKTREEKKTTTIQWKMIDLQTVTAATPTANP